MTGLWVALALAGVAAVAGVFYWQLIIAEGAYLGPRAVARTYNWIASRYDAIKQFNPREESWFLAVPLLRALAGPPCPLVLDLATGTGRLPIALFRDHFQGRVIGVDLSLGMLRQARAKLRPYADQIRLIWHDAEHLPFDDGAFDAVTCLESLEFFAHPLESLIEMVRVLRPGGMLMVTNRVGREARLLPGHALSRPQFEQALASLGLVEIDVRPWQVSYDLATARKKGMLGAGDAQPPSVAVHCPTCGDELSDITAALSCPTCGRKYPVLDGIVCLEAR